MLGVVNINRLLLLCVYTQTCNVLIPTSIFRKEKYRSHISDEVLY